MTRHSTRIERNAPTVGETPFVIWLAGQVNRDDKVGDLARRSLAASLQDPVMRETLHSAIAEWGATVLHGIYPPT